MLENRSMRPAGILLLFHCEMMHTYEIRAVPSKIIIPKSKRAIFAKIQQFSLAKIHSSMCSYLVIFQKYLGMNFSPKGYIFLEGFKIFIWSCVCPDVVFTFNKSDGHRFLLPYFLFSNPLSSVA